MKFNEYGLLSHKDMDSALTEYKKDPIKSSHLKFGRHTEMALVNYLMGRSVEDIAQEMNVTRERIRAMLSKVQRRLGVTPPPIPLSEWVERSDMVDLRNRVTSLIVEYVATGQYEHKPVQSLVDDVMDAFRTYVENTGYYQND